MAQERELSSSSQKCSLLRSLLDILESVLDLVSFSISLHEKNQSNSALPPQNNTSHATNSGQDFASSPLRVVIESGPLPPTPTEEEKKRSERKERRNNDAEERDRTRLAVDIALAIFTSLLFLVNVWLVLTTRSQNQLVRQQLVGTQAAMVSINGPIGIGPDGIRKNTNVSIGFRNDGHVNAVSIVVKLKARVIQLPENTPSGKQWDCGETIPVLAPTQVPQALPIYVQCFLEGLSDEDLKQIPELTRTVAIDGEYSYGNGFGDKITQTICRRFMPKVKTGYGSGTEGDDVFEECGPFRVERESILRHLNYKKP